MKASILFSLVLATVSINVSAETADVPLTSKLAVGTMLTFLSPYGGYSEIVMRVDAHRTLVMRDGNARWEDNDLLNSKYSDARVYGPRPTTKSMVLVPNLDAKGEIVSGYKMFPVDHEVVDEFGHHYAVTPGGKIFGIGVHSFNGRIAGSVASFFKTNITVESTDTAKDAIAKYNASAAKAGVAGFDPVDPNSMINYSASNDFVDLKTAVKEANRFDAVTAAQKAVREAAEAAVDNAGKEGVAIDVKDIADKGVRR